VDGILISVSSETKSSDHITELINFGKPLVFFDRVCEDVETGSIITNDIESSYEATCHLLRQGCKKIAYLYTSPDLSINKKRLEGYSKALQEFGLQPGEENIVLCDGNSEANYHTIYKMLNSKNRPDGIIACVEKLTTPVYLSCKALQLSIPEKIKVISFTNLQAALILSPTLTTVTQPAFEMGKAAAELLFKAIQKSNYNLKKEKIIIPSCLNVRDSTG
jgi:LacI family transcriptional regulator